MHHDDYLERAQECLKLAAETADTELKASLTQAAVQWEQLAAETGDHDRGIFECRLAMDTAVLIVVVVGALLLLNALR